MLTDADLEKHLITACNAPRDLADFETLSMWRSIPTYVHAHFKPDTFGFVAQEAEESKDRIID